MGWKLDSLKMTLVCKDRYAIRYVTPMKYRVVAFKFYQNSCRYSDTVAFYYEFYASRDDAIQAAKNWCLRGELERLEDEAKPYNLALGVYSEPAPTVERPSW